MRCCVPASHLVGLVVPHADVAVAVDVGQPGLHRVEVDAVDLLLAAPHGDHMQQLRAAIERQLARGWGRGFSHCDRRKDGGHRALPTSQQAISHTVVCPRDAGEGLGRQLSRAPARQGGAPSSWAVLRALLSASHYLNFRSPPGATRALWPQLPLQLVPLPAFSSSQYP